MQNAAIRDAVSADIETLVREEVARQMAEHKQKVDAELSALKERTLEDKAALIIFSGDLDKVLASLVIGTGAAAAGLDTTMFFTFWGLGAIKKAGASSGDKTFKQKLFSMMTPDSLGGLGTSKMNYFGVGAQMFRSMMKEKDVQSPEELFALAQELGVKMIACNMSMDVMGVSPTDLIDGVQLGGVAAFLGEASGARLSLFI